MNSQRGRELRLASAFVVATLIVTTTGCRSEKTETMRVPKDGAGSQASSAPAGSAPAGGDMGQMGGAPMGGDPMAMPNDSIHAGLAGGGMGAMGDGAMGGGAMGGGAMSGGAGGDAGTASLHWTTPSGWGEKPPSSMRVGSYEVPGAGGPADMSIVVLSGQAGGDLANVNRWRGQIGLGPIDEAQLAKDARQVKTPSGDVMVVEFGGAEAGGKRMITGILVKSGETWFFKLNGPDATVSGARGSFMNLLESVHAPHDD